MGEVYLARHTKLGTNVAIKLLPAKFSNDARRLAMFEREARMAARLNHTNIATVHDFFEIDDRHYFVMEFVGGKTLGDLLEDQQPIPLPKLLDIAVQISQGLAAAHGRNIIHRDLKPGNVMITPEGRVKLLDFGLAKAIPTADGLTTGLGASVFSSDAILGTLGYMSPEQARGGDVDARTDLFALGVILYEMATGEQPFRRPSGADTISAILNDRPTCATIVNPDIPREVGDLIDKLLAKKREDRYQVAGLWESRSSPFVSIHSPQ